MIHRPEGLRYQIPTRRQDFIPNATVPRDAM